MFLRAGYGFASLSTLRFLLATPPSESNIHKYECNSAFKGGNIDWRLQIKSWGENTLLPREKAANPNFSAI